MPQLDADADVSPRAPERLCGTLIGSCKAVDRASPCCCSSVIMRTALCNGILLPAWWLFQEDQQMAQLPASVAHAATANSTFNLRIGRSAQVCEC